MKRYFVTVTRTEVFDVQIDDGDHEDVAAGLARDAFALNPGACDVVDVSLNPHAMPTPSPLPSA